MKDIEYILGQMQVAPFELYYYYRNRMPAWKPPLREHGPEEDERFCRKHYQPKANFGFLNFFCDTRWGPCRECQKEDRQAWLEEVENRLNFGLAMAAEGRPFTWRPAADSPEAILARMMDLQDAPATFEETMRWVHKYLPEGLSHEARTTGP